MSATAPDLTTPQPTKILLKPGPQTLNLQLKVASTMQQVTVQENAGPSVSTESSNNASALVLRGEDLQALSDDPDDLMADLQALAGPAAGPNGGSLYIDGFSGGELPPKETFGTRAIPTPPKRRRCYSTNWKAIPVDRSASAHRLRLTRKGTWSTPAPSSMP